MYAGWRLDRPKEADKTKELISSDYRHIRHLTTVDKLDVYPEKGCDTIYKALYKRSHDAEMKKKDFLGTRKGNKYEWTKLSEASLLAQYFASGCMKLKLCPEVKADDEIWRFIGIKSKNREEWAIVHLANMHIGCTTVGIVDTFCTHTTAKIIRQTELKTICCSVNKVESILKSKHADDQVEEFLDRY